MLVYIAGPLSHPNILERERNVRQAIFTAWHVMRAGHQPLVPHLTHYQDVLWTCTGETVPYETWMNWALELVRRCDAVLRMEGPSPGADREVAIARELGMPVYFAVGELP